MTAAAELSSLATALDELAVRITRIADGLGATDRASFGTELYEVERSLLAARRRLTKVVADTR